MEQLVLLAMIYDIGLGCGIFNVKDTIKFCDLVIEYIDTSPYEFIEASMMSDTKIDDIKTKLAEFHKTGANEYIVKIILSIISKMYLNKQIDAKHAISSTARLLLHTGFSCEKEYYELYNYDDCYDLAESKVYDDIDNVSNSFEKCISEYNPYFQDFFDIYSSIFKGCSVPGCSESVST